MAKRCLRLTNTYELALLVSLNGVVKRNHRTHPNPWSALSRADCFGSDASGFYNTEFFVDLRPRSAWRSEHETKDSLIAAMDTELIKFPGVDWNFSQPISDNVEEAVSGVKGELAVKLSAQT
jgi:Cu/Ag efflux pump CusA